MITRRDLIDPMSQLARRVVKDERGQFIIRPLSGGGGGGSNNNPDGFPTTGNLWMSRDYETEITSQVQPSPPSSSCTWGSTFGRSSSGGWRTTCIQATGEDSTGWLYNNPGIGAVDDWRTVFYSFTMKLSTSFVNTLRNLTNPLKFLDARQYLADGSGPDSVNFRTRWVNYLVGDGSGRLKFSLTVGGAGGFFFDDGVNINPDLATFIDNEFVWFCMMQSEENLLTAIYMKRQGDSGVTKMIQRDSSVGAPTESYQSNGRGFVVGERTFCGYWEFADYLGNGTEHAFLDDFVVADYWTGPIW
jgi:hypothetical protein